VENVSLMGPNFSDVKVSLIMRVSNGKIVVWMRIEFGPLHSPP
jgi:hypothetical protein